MPADIIDLPGILARRGAEFGLSFGSLQIDMAGVQRRKRNMVEDQIKGHLDLYKSRGAELIMGTARFVGPRTRSANSHGAYRGRHDLLSVCESSQSQSCFTPLKRKTAPEILGWLTAPGLW